MAWPTNASKRQAQRILQLEREKRELEKRCDDLISRSNFRNRMAAERDRRQETIREMWDNQHIERLAATLLSGQSSYSYDRPGDSSINWALDRAKRIVQKNRG